MIYPLSLTCSLFSSTLLTSNPKPLIPIVLNGASSKTSKSLLATQLYLNLFQTDLKKNIPCFVKEVNIKIIFPERYVKSVSLVF